MSVQMEITPSPDSLRQLEVHARLIADLTRPDPAITDRLSQLIREGFSENFGNEAQGNGVPWEKLAPWTVSERIFEGHEGEHPILIRTGAYWRSWVELDSPHHVSVREFGPGGWTIGEGTSDPRAATLEEGGTTDTGHAVPPRPVSQLSEEAERRLAQALFDWLTHKLP